MKPHRVEFWEFNETVREYVRVLSIVAQGGSFTVEFQDPAAAGLVEFLRTRPLPTGRAGERALPKDGTRWLTALQVSLASAYLRIAITPLSET